MLDSFEVCNVDQCGERKQKNQQTNKVEGDQRSKNWNLKKDNFFCPINGTSQRGPI